MIQLQKPVFPVIEIFKSVLQNTGANNIVILVTIKATDY